MKKLFSTVIATGTIFLGLSVAAHAATTADIVFLVDESGSMSIGTISGISFDADIDSGNVRLLVTAASVGSALKMVHKIINTTPVSV